MRKTVALTTVLTVLLLASQASAATDPRVCAAGVPQTCSKTAAVIALKQTIAAKTGQKVWKLGPISCMSPGGSNLVWKCAYQTGHGTISFRQTGGDWKATVWVN